MKYFNFCDLRNVFPPFTWESGREVDLARKRQSFHQHYYSPDITLFPASGYFLPMLADLPTTPLSQIQSKIMKSKYNPVVEPFGHKTNKMY